MTRKIWNSFKKSRKVCGKLTEIENEDCYFMILCRNCHDTVKMGLRTYFLLSEKKTENLSNSHTNSQITYYKIRG